jgi:single-strand DNA-binding protein
LVIAQVGDRPGPKKQLDISNEKENSMAERSVNKAILLGRLGSDAETRFTQNGTPVSRVSLAMNRQWTDSDKQVHEETDWMSIVIWNKENLATYLTKGTKLYVEGRLQTRSYDDKEGVKRYVTEVVAENLVLLGGVGNGNSNGNGRGAKEKTGRRQTRGTPSTSHRDREPEPEEQGLQDDDVPF